MINFKYAATPLLLGALALTGCPGDDSPADTDNPNNGSTSTGDVATDTLPPDDTTTDNPTTSDPTTGVDSTGDSSTTDPPMECDPACEAGECCVAGLCFAAPDPTCDTECAEGEICAFPEGADACVDAAECVADVGLCPGGWGDGNYDTCLGDTGAPDITLCAEGSLCIADGDPASITICAAQGCTEVCDCPQPPDSGDATVTCADVTDDMVNDCYLSCEADETCPAGMSCFGGFVCAWAVPQPQPGYLNCSLTDFMCQVGEECLQDGDGAGVPATWSVCSQPMCETEVDCTFVPPASGDAPVACGDPAGKGGDNTCYLDCSAEGTVCPDGMSCINDSWCAAAAGDTVFYDDFQTADFSMGWTLQDVDGQTPAEAVDFVNDAWVVSDQYDGGAGANLAAYSTSWYDPAGASDDWLISPQIMLGANAQLQWRARNQDPSFPDGYEVRISTAGPDIADFEANPALFTIAAENAGAAYTFRTLDLAAEGYADQMVYLAWRNNSNDQFVLLVDDVAVVDFPAP